MTMMGRLRRFPDNRFIGRRDLMVAYDCDDESQFEDLRASTEELALDHRNLLQAVAPDTLTEAQNRGFRPADRRGTQPSAAP
jgi:hypothetical protein